MSPFKRLAAAFLFLAGSRRRLSQYEPPRFAGLGGHLVLLGLLWGVLLAGLWETTYRLTTWARLMGWVVPACVCAVVTVLGPCRPGCLSLAQAVTATKRPKWFRLLRRPVFLGLAGAWAALNHALGWKEPHWPMWLPAQLAWLWPKAMYRVLLLAPVWGAWSMLVIGQFHRPTARTDPRTRHFAAGVKPIASAAYLVVPLAGTFVYLLFLWPPLRFVPPAAALLAALGGGAFIVRLRGGLDRETVLATNVVTQLAFLAACAAVM
jgi:hypothetical protein